jgi:hypothetical protein
LTRARWAAAAGGAVIGAFALGGLDHFELRAQLGVLAVSLALGLLLAWAAGRHARTAFTSFWGFLGAFLGPLLIAFVVFLVNGE